MSKRRTSTKRTGEHYHLTDGHLVAENDTERILNAHEVLELYLSVDSSLTKFISLMGYPETGYGRRVANQVFARYKLQPKQHQYLKIDEIPFEEVQRAYQSSSSLTEIGRKLGARSEDHAYTIGKKAVDKWNLDKSKLHWQVTDIANEIPQDEAVCMIEGSSTLRELGQFIRERTGSKSNRIYLARKIISLYGLDDTKFQQCPVAGMTRDEVLDLYMSCDYKDDFMKQLGYARTDKFHLIVDRFGLPERAWEYKPSKPRRKSGRKEQKPRTPRKSSHANTYPSKQWRSLDSRYVEEYVPTKERLVIARGYACEECGRTMWQGRRIPLEVHHINGDHQDNRWDNVQLLCCNCHNKFSLQQAHDRQGQMRVVTDEELIEALKSSETISAAIRMMHMAMGKHVFNRCNMLIVKFQISPHYDAMMEGLEG